MKLWQDLLNVLEIEFNYLSKLNDVMIEEQAIIIDNNAIALKEVLEKQRELLQKNFQIESYRREVLKKMVDEGYIPDDDIDINKILKFVPLVLKKKFIEIANKLKMLSFSIAELNKRNELLLNNAIKIIDDELRLFTLNGDKTLYRKDGEFKENVLNIINRKI